MTDRPSVIVLTPRFSSLARFGAETVDARFRVRTRSGHPASLSNLEALINSALPTPRLSFGLADAPPMAGYHLESFLKLAGYDARALFDWTGDAELEHALATDPIAILLSTTLITDPDLLAVVLGDLRRLATGVPILVGGPFVLKQARILRRGDRSRRARALREFGVDDDRDILFRADPDPRTTGAIYVASESGERTALEVLELLWCGADRDALAAVPNLVLGGEGGAWQVTKVAEHPIDVDRDHTRWDLVERMPTIVPIRTSLGCPGCCRYCDFFLLHRRSALRSIESIIAEIAAAAARGARFFNFTDDNVFATEQRAAEIGRGIVEAELDLVWGGFLALDRLTQENLGPLLASGWRFSLSGVESGAPEQLARMGRECDLARLGTGIELATAAGVDVALTFIVGFPGETAETIDATAAFINDLPLRNRGYTSFEVYRYLLVAGSPADAPGFRKLFDLRGRHDRWSHATMTATEASAVWIPRLLHMVERIPYNHSTSDNPTWWSMDKRVEGWRLRRDLALAFLDREPDDVVQERFAALHALVAEPERTTPAPRWDDMLAERGRQPGAPDR